MRGMGRHDRHLLSWLALGLWAALAAGCNRDRLALTRGEVYFLPDKLELSAWPGASDQATVELHNDGRAGYALDWTAPDAPFELVDPPAEAPAGVLPLTVRFLPQKTGRFEAAAAAAFTAEGTARLTLVGNGLPLPACDDDTPCHHWSFDVAQGKCVDAVAPDGTACDPQNVCLQSTTCQQGRCIGKGVGCDDGDLCTIDMCNAVTGCEHVPAPPCEGDGKCQVGVCDPKLGCQLAPAMDGTFCGSTRTCDVADVCIAGQCVQRDPPDGYVCAYASPCQGEGRCQGSTCVRGPATAIAPAWAFDGYPTADGGSERPFLHDFVMEPSGAMTLSGWLRETVLLRANTAQALPGEGAARRCILWNGNLVCADYPTPLDGVFAAVDLSTGQRIWSVDLAALRPDLAALTRQLFMARLASMGSDRLAALFEAYPVDSADPTQCRMFFLVLVDPAGNLVSAQQLKDPFLDVCYHPHPFGVAASANGDLFLAYSPTTDHAPLLPGAPSLLLSFSRDGLLRWKRTESIKGGELAVAHGVVYTEGAHSGFWTATGAPYNILPSPRPYGRLVVSQGQIIPAPIPGQGDLLGLDVASGRAVWSYVLPGGETFRTDEIRLAGWRYLPLELPETVALVFTNRNATPTLVAVSAKDGVERWACPLSYVPRTMPDGSPSLPQLFEVQNGALGLMDGAETCGHCDPPYAESRATFHSFALPRIEAPTEPWEGTFGGAGHGHHEKLTYLPGQ